MFTALFTDSIIISPYVKQTTSDLVWSIAAGPGENYNPDRLSELTFTNMKNRGLGVEIGWMARLNENIAFILEGKFSKSDLQSGDVRDSDYASSGRSTEFSRSYAQSDDGSDEYFSATVGLKYRWFQTKGHYISFLLGLSKLDRDINISQGVQYLPLENRGAQLVGLNSSYDSRWNSLFYSVSTEHAFTWGTVGFQVKMHPGMEFDADANWNLREDFAHPTSFAHTGEGDGIEYVFGYSYAFHDQSDIYTQYEIMEFNVADGYDHVFYGDGSSYVTRLNNADLESQSLVFGYRHWF